MAVSILEKDGSFRVSSEDLNALASLQDEFKKCVVSLYWLIRSSFECEGAKSYNLNLAFGLEKVYSVTIIHQICGDTVLWIALLVLWWRYIVEIRILSGMQFSFPNWSFWQRGGEETGGLFGLHSGVGQRTGFKRWLHTAVWDTYYVLLNTSYVERRYLQSFKSFLVILTIILWHLIAV